MSANDESVVPPPEVAALQRELQTKGELLAQTWKKLQVAQDEVESLREQCAFMKRMTDDAQAAALEYGRAWADLQEKVSESGLPLDDPKLQELFSNTIWGALCFGLRGVNQPPAGHWLVPFWDFGREQSRRRCDV